jgi:hypothetical protein
MTDDPFLTHRSLLVSSEQIHGGDEMLLTSPMRLRLGVGKAALIDR